MTTPSPELSPGIVIDGHTIGSKIRARSGAATYIAKDPQGGDVHLTIYASECFSSTLIRERSLRELRQLQGIDAPEIAKVLGSGKLEDGCIYEVNECIDGAPLASAGQMGADVMGATMDAVGRALLAAQKVGVIHRNLGTNVVFSTSGGLKVIGFAVGEPQGGAAHGSIDSIAPEQVMGKVVDQRTLIYNLAAMAHQLLSGQPLFEGSPEQKLDLHANREAPSVDPMLKRALSKDARMRPMMLKQFLGEFAKLSGASSSASAPAPTAKPSTRGWTMFMEAQEATPEGTAASPSPVVGPAPGPTAPASMTPSAPVPAPSSPVIPAPAAPTAAPSTRGWTMFMEAPDPASSDAAAPTSPAVAPAPAPAAPQPVVSAPAPAQPAAAAPSTRGWTMFMEAEEQPGAAAAGPAPAPAPSPAVAPAPSPAVAPAPSPAVAPAPSQPVTPEPAAAAAPSTRGWTMFMEAEDGAPAAPTPPAMAPAPAVPVPVPSQPVVPSQPAAPQSAKPSTRGWTMFMEAEAPSGDLAVTSGAEAAPAQPVQPLQPVQPAQPVGSSSAPSTRGWTMFMEAQVPAETPGEETPGAEAPGAPGQPVQPAPAPAPAPSEPAPTADQAQSGASDSKGWTVFMEKPNVADEPGAAQLSENELAVTHEQPAQSAATHEEQQATAQYAAQAPVGVSKQTLVMDEAPEIRPAEQRREPSAPVQTSIPTRPAIEAGGQQFTQPSPNQMAPASPPVAQMVAQESNKTGLYVGIGIAAIVIVIIIVMML